MPASEGKPPILEQATKRAADQGSHQRARTLVSFVVGLLFAVGLAISGMTHPEKVIGFLDFFGDWDPDLLFVMGGAVATFYVLRRFTSGMTGPVFGSEFHLPTKRSLDAPLIVGAVCFGVGWGLLGFCPGPALVSAATLEPQTLLFIGAMFGGMFGHTIWKRLRATTIR